MTTTRTVPATQACWLRPVGQSYCYGCGHEPCLMTPYGSACTGRHPVSPFWLGYQSLADACHVLADKPGWTVNQRVDYLDGVQYRAQVERANLLALAAHHELSSGGTP